MGGCWSRKAPIDYEHEEVNFNQFKLLRSVGKGAFGKVCIVMKRDTKKLYAMKYMSKDRILAENALKNVYNEKKILELLNFPLIVNIWFAFQDAEDMFMVVDLMLGGDLRYHLRRYGPFREDRVRVHMAEAAIALEYIHSMGVVHRDIKPDNLLMDADGHVHLADFNVASFVPEGGIMRWRAGTRPYMAPEMVASDGYTVAADWWSLGVTMLELLTGKNPFRGATVDEVNMNVLHLDIPWPTQLTPEGLDFLQKLVERDPSRRIGTPNNMHVLKSHPFFERLDIVWEDVPKKLLQPAFVPDKDKINCDAMYELEEMMLEENPLYRKKARLRKEEQRRRNSQAMPPTPGSKEDQLAQVERAYKVFDREKMLRIGTSNMSTKLSSSRLREMKSGNLISDSLDELSGSALDRGASNQPSEPPILEEADMMGGGHGNFNHTNGDSSAIVPA